MTQDVPPTSNSGDEPQTPGPAAEAAVEALQAERDALSGAIEQAVAEELSRIPESRRSLVPESLPPADRLVYLMQNRELLTQPEAPNAQSGASERALTFGGEKPLATSRVDRAWAELTYNEKVRLAKERPDQFRRIRETHLNRNVVATR